MQESVIRPMTAPGPAIHKASRQRPATTRRLPPEVACLVLDRLDSVDLLSCLDLRVFVNVDADGERRRRAEIRSRGTKKRDLVRRGDIETLEYIRETRGARFFLQDVALAAGGGHLNVVKWLYEHAQEGHPCGAIEAAAAGGHLATVDWLMRKETTGTEGTIHRAIVKAAKYGHLSVVQYMCENHSVGRYSMILATTEAARRGHACIVEFLCSRGSSAPRDDEVDTMVDTAAEHGHAEVVEFLYARFGRSGTSRGLFGAVGDAYVDLAVRLHDIDPQRASLLKERRRVIGADAPSAALWKDYEARAGDGMTLFHGPGSYQNHRMSQSTMGLIDVACATGSLDMVAALWQRNAGTWTRSLLCCAVMGGNADILRHLIAHRDTLRARTPRCWSWHDLADAMEDAFVLARPDLAVLVERLYALLADDPDHPAVCLAPLAPVDDAALADFYSRALTNGLGQRGIMANAVISGHANLVADLRMRGFSIASVPSHTLAEHGNIDLLRLLTDNDLQRFNSFLGRNALFYGRRVDMIRYIYVERGAPVPDVATDYGDGGDSDYDQDSGADDPFWDQDNLVASLVSDPSADADLVVGLLACYKSRGDVRIGFRINRVLLAAVEHGRSDIVDAVATRFSCVSTEDLTIDADFGQQSCDVGLLGRVCDMYKYVVWRRSRLWVHAARRNDRATIEWLCDRDLLSAGQRTDAIDAAAKAGHRRLVEWMWERGFRPSDRYARAAPCGRDNDHLYADHNAAECFLFGRAK
ncbi:Ankyrin repeat domain containing protein [Pandoravirus neocaledonia]|uniref:Ankyrin repeat domain containing protein n=1 Tax=Pandoravirus neocaledonia TaxID=2107708 RepID=A0A2U7UDW1_9VIRU|nr:Ankyrin repeat domain containing protein [Pandoravirus neocaledonia]AVK76623.1 Ankyrin repeat domain containing protein [Pandoravirus neocaledonia]